MCLRVFSGVWLVNLDDENDDANVLGDTARESYTNGASAGMVVSQTSYARPIRKCSVDAVGGIPMFRIILRLQPIRLGCSCTGSTTRASVTRIRYGGARAP